MNGVCEIMKANQKFKSLKEDTNAGAAGMLVSILVTVILAGVLLPVALDYVSELSTNLTEEGHTDEAALIDVLPIIIVIGIFLIVLGIVL